ncbi:16S rRNA (adenine(1518)-N(6)/adenine(1519)-N(6))-dimethyltransferase RsmA [Oxyplasma meridianum]|uniref:16S rRNA (Adenine(1518)-N(6)/adenine(1519)-N(6))-dimethyltransferase RsmA n=1 Tax=Oxyplasma meridianum TaxID=3073602 RepID=A0AAX4NE77_9ARCH
MTSINLYPKKYGQVLLKDKNIALKEVILLGDIMGRSVLEIGPGPGTLTEILLQKGSIVNAIEPDHQFYEILKLKFDTQLNGGSLKIEKNDFLELSGGTYDFIIGNIPYHISSPILFHLEKFHFMRSILMVQLEFAKRMVAQPGTDEYSRLSISTALRYKVKLEKVVKRGSFYPVPEVDSAIVSIEPNPVKWEYPPNLTNQILTEIFSQRRKKLKNIIKNLPEELMNKRADILTIEDLKKIMEIS